MDKQCLLDRISIVMGLQKDGVFKRIAGGFKSTLAAREVIDIGLIGIGNDFYAVRFVKDPWNHPVIDVRIVLARVTGER